MKRIVLYVILSCLFLVSDPAMTCNVPVFRYALERWAADNYEVFIFHRGALSPGDRAVVDWLKQSSNTQIPYSNYIVHTFDLETELERPIRDFWKALGSPEVPYMAVFYPDNFWIKGTVWDGRLTADAVRTLIKSPVRTEIAKRILNGESAVWIFLESGNREKDDAGADILQTQLKSLEKSLTLPALTDADTFNDYVIVNENGPELHVAFSMIRLSRTDSAESHFISMLMKSEPDLFEYSSYPMAFPVYGRGRILYALIGDGINENVIHKACQFIIGPCSCIIKYDNPGVDILMMTDWDSGIAGRWVEDVELPTLTSLSELAHIAASDENPGTNIEKIEINEASSHLIRNILLILVFFAVITVILSLRIKWSGNKE
ncbi:hypothetical protein ACFL4Z_01575 [candidate division KSB1 bacterium]